MSGSGHRDANGREKTDIEEKLRKQLTTKGDLGVGGKGRFSHPVIPRDLTKM